MAVSFQLSEADRPPGWLRRRYGHLWSQVMRWIADATQTAARQAIYQRFPLLAASDALPYLARERMTDRGPLEPESTFRARLDNVWERAQLWGTSAGIVAEVEAYFLAAGMTNVEVYSQNDNWAGDGNVTNWARFWLVIGQPNTWSQWSFGPGVEFGPELLFGTDMEATHYVALARIINRYRPAHVRCVEIVVLQAGSPDVPADIAADPTLRYVNPNVSLAVGQYFNCAGFETFGPSQVFGPKPPML